MGTIMRYIRTKDGIYDLEKSLFHQYNGIRVLTPYCKQYEENPSLCKTADTIEELCDEFLDTSELKTTNTGGWLYDEFDSDNKCLVYYAEDERRTIPLNEFDDLSKIYGAIWTEWGLKYVAKMNEKGELELL